MLDVEWIRTRCLDWEKGYGAVFLEKNNEVSQYVDVPTLDWLPTEAWSLEDTCGRIIPLVYERLIRDLRQGAEIAGKRRRKHMLQAISQFQRMHSALLRLVNVGVAKK
jgi:hypothetical protein